MDAIKKLKVTELKKVLEQHNQPLHGRKDDLVERVFDLSTNEGKTVEELLATEKENATEDPIVEKKSPVAVKEAVQKKLTETTEESVTVVSKDQKWHVEYLERQQRLLKFGGEVSELDKKIERMMRFGELTKDDPFSKIKQQGAQPANKNSRPNRGTFRGRFQPRGRDNRHWTPSSRPY